MKNTIPQSIHVHAITLGKQLEDGKPWRKLGGRRQRARFGEKPPIVFKLSNDYQLYCWFKGSLPVRFQIVKNSPCD